MVAAPSVLDCKTNPCTPNVENHINYNKKKKKEREKISDFDPQFKKKKMILELSFPPT